MKLFITAKPGAGEARIEKTDDTHFIVAVKEPPVQGRANAAIVKALAEFFSVPSWKVRIISGRISRQKVVEVLS